MILIHLLFILVVIIALIAQLITPLILNIPLIALSLVVLIFTLWTFRRARRKKKIPFVAGLASGIQIIFFLLSLAILAVVTIPNESPEDSPAIVQGIRRFLVGHGLIDKPKVMAPRAVLGSAEKKAAETLNAPDASKIQIQIEDEPKNPPRAEAEDKKL